MRNQVNVSGPRFRRIAAAMIVVAGAAVALWSNGAWAQETGPGGSLPPKSVVATTPTVFSWLGSNGAAYVLTVNHTSNTFTLDQGSRLNEGNYFVNPDTKLVTFVIQSGPDYPAQFSGKATRTGYNSSSKAGTYSSASTTYPNGFFILWWATMA
jgi:hypothetical protein